jgi:orotidine-5'-phosphate decarboxylase
MLPAQRIFVALDTTDLDLAEELAWKLKEYVGGIKLGKEFFTAHGPVGVEHILRCNLPVFLDLKYHDIPTTVANAITALTFNPQMLTIHAIGGRTMMKAAATAAKQHPGQPLVLAVTVLSSLNDIDLTEIGIMGDAATQTLKLGRLAKDCGLNGAVCSSHEIKLLRKELGTEFKLIVPGIRPVWAITNDQKRTMTPAEALDAGADYLVIGRPITKAADPVAATTRIIDELS